MFLSKNAKIAIISAGCIIALLLIVVAVVVCICAIKNKKHVSHLLSNSGEEKKPEQRVRVESERGIAKEGQTGRIQALPNDGKLRVPDGDALSDISGENEEFVEPDGVKVPDASNGVPTGNDGESVKRDIVHNENVVGTQKPVVPDVHETVVPGELIRGLGGGSSGVKNAPISGPKIYKKPSPSQNHLSKGTHVKESPKAIPTQMVLSEEREKLRSYLVSIKDLSEEDRKRVISDKRIIACILQDKGGYLRGHVAEMIYRLKNRRTPYKGAFMILNDVIDVGSLVHVSVTMIVVVAKRIWQSPDNFLIISEFCTMDEFLDSVDYYATGKKVFDSYDLNADLPQSSKESLLPEGIDVKVARVRDWVTSKMEEGELSSEDSCMKFALVQGAGGFIGGKLGTVIHKAFPNPVRGAFVCIKNVYEAKERQYDGEQILKCTVDITISVFNNVPDKQGKYDSELSYTCTLDTLCECVDYTATEDKDFEHYKDIPVRSLVASEENASVDVAPSDPVASSDAEEKDVEKPGLLSQVASRVGLGRFFHK